jgi:hypothetical protein
VHAPDVRRASNDPEPEEAGGPMTDLGWLLLVVVLFALVRALVRLCERLM